MPQLDRLAYISEEIWLVVIFFCCYIIIVSNGLINFYKILSYRIDILVRSRSAKGKDFFKLIMYRKVVNKGIFYNKLEGLFVDNIGSIFIIKDFEKNDSILVLPNVEIQLEERIDALKLQWMVLLEIVENILLKNKGVVIEEIKDTLIQK